MRLPFPPQFGSGQVTAQPCASWVHQKWTPSRIHGSGSSGQRKNLPTFNGALGFISSEHHARFLLSLILMAFTNGISSNWANHSQAALQNGQFTLSRILEPHSN